MGDKAHLVFGQDVMLAAVALQPALHHGAVEGDALHAAPLGAQAFDLRDETSDQLQGEGSGGQFLQVMDRADGVEHAVGVGAGQCRFQVEANLLVRPWQEQQGTILTCVHFAAFLLREVGLLRTQGREIRGPAGQYHFQQPGLAI